MGSRQMVETYEADNSWRASKELVISWYEANTRAVRKRVLNWRRAGKELAESWELIKSRRSKELAGS